MPRAVAGYTSKGLGVLRGVCVRGEGTVCDLWRRLVAIADEDACLGGYVEFGSVRYESDRRVGSGASP